MIVIRRAIETDIPVLVSFQERMAFETEGISLEISVLTEGVKALFADPAKGCYFVAMDDVKVVASLLITYEWSDWRNRTIYWIQSVFVDPVHRRKGIYRQLYLFIQEIAKNDESIGGIRLYVDRTNINAQHTYTALGMNGEHYQVFEWMK
jgi:ribosomal protein S18 acetylase RimI-like enzyme